MMLEYMEEMVLNNKPKRKNYASRAAYQKAKMEYDKLCREYLFWVEPEEYREHCVFA